jgi:hypothetical protein
VSIEVATIYEQKQRQLAIKTGIRTVNCVRICPSLCMPELLTSLSLQVQLVKSMVRIQVNSQVIHSK